MRDKAWFEALGCPVDTAKLAAMMRSYRTWRNEGHIAATQTTRV
jgi:hypothetical protein